MSEDKKLNEVIRVKKRPSNFVMMDKTFLEDDRLSYKAKGLLAYLLSKPDDWKVIVGNLVNSSKDGKASVYAGLKELHVTINPSWKVSIRLEVYYEDKEKDYMFGTVYFKVNIADDVALKEIIVDAIRSRLSQ